MPGADEVAVVAARADRRDLRRLIVCMKSAGRRHAPLQRQAPLAAPPGRGPPATPGRGRAPRAGRARRGSTRRASRARTPPRPTPRPGRAALVESASFGVGTVAVDPALEGSDVRRRRTRGGGCGRRAAGRRGGAQRGDAVGQDVVPRLPPDQAGRRDHPLVGVEGPQLLVRVEPRVELHRADTGRLVP